MSAGHNTNKRISSPPRYDADFLATLRARLPDYLRNIGCDLRPAGARLVCRCPNPLHEDKKPSFSVFADAQKCGCYPCDWTGDVFALAQWIGHAGSFPQAVAAVAAALGVALPSEGPPRPAGSRPAPQAAKPSPAAPVASARPPLTDSEKAMIHRARLAFDDAFDAGELEPFAQELGVSVGALRYAAAGTDSLGIHNGRLCYVYSTGLKLRGLPGETPRFRWLCGHAARPWRWPWVKSHTRKIILCEGESDCIGAIACDVEADGQTVAIAAPGTSFPAAWRHLFRGLEVTIVFDTDTAGTKAAKTVAGLLNGHAASVKIWKPNLL